MCLLTYFDPEIQPDLDALDNGGIVNRDGHGWAIVVPNKDNELWRLIVGHSLSRREAIDGFAEARKRHPEGAALFHSRFGTAGSESLHNCHPFRIGSDRKTVLAHNGIFSKALQPGKGDDRCDTRILAQDWIPRVYGDLSTTKARTDLEKGIGPGNKVVILSANPRYANQAYILNQQSGVWVDAKDGTKDAIWYSNDGYKARKWTTGTDYGYTGVGGWSWVDDCGYTTSDWRDRFTWVKGQDGIWRARNVAPAETQCEMCKHILTEAEIELGNCSVCDWCMDCHSLPGICQCHSHALRSTAEARAEQISKALEAIEATNA